MSRTNFFLLVLPVIAMSQYYNPSIYQGFVSSGVPRQQTVLVPVYTQGNTGGVYGGYNGMVGLSSGYPSYGMAYPGYGVGNGYSGGEFSMMGTGGCCGGGSIMPFRESNAKKFFKGASEGVYMGSFGMLGFRK